MMTVYTGSNFNRPEFQRMMEAMKAGYTISNLLKNQAYIGNMVQGKRRGSLYENEARHFTDEEDWIVVENTHEAIVDKELFDRVRTIMGQKVEDSAFSSEREVRICL